MAFVLALRWFFRIQSNRFHKIVSSARFSPTDGPYCIAKEPLIQTSCIPKCISCNLNYQRPNNHESTLSVTPLAENLLMDASVLVAPEYQEMIVN